MARRRRTVVRLKPLALWDRLALLHRSQNWLADELGISRSHLSRLVNGERAASSRLRRRMQRVLGEEDFHELFFIERHEDGE
ncbi:MAG: helix-turn-helix domain-containing protein [Chloroflexota bacterium]|nr:helix-turn-helix domain-containing protein [Chloroflexota bacterium]MDE2844089.1 helix-turn-helix domain-containing protein [Chloroflexota bacterium]